jgi:hypothetical protein
MRFLKSRTGNELHIQLDRTGQELAEVIQNLLQWAARITHLDGENPPELPNLLKRESADDIVWGITGKDARWFARFRRLLSQIDEVDRKLLLFMVQKMVREKDD